MKPRLFLFLFLFPVLAFAAGGNKPILPWLTPSQLAGFKTVSITMRTNHNDSGGIFFPSIETSDQEKELTEVTLKLSAPPQEAFKPLFPDEEPSLACSAYFIVTDGNYNVLIHTLLFNTWNVPKEHQKREFSVNIASDMLEHAYITLHWEKNRNDTFRIVSLEPVKAQAVDNAIDLTGANADSFRSNLGHTVTLRGRLEQGVQGPCLFEATPTNVVFYVMPDRPSSGHFSYPEKWVGLTHEQVRLTGELKFQSFDRSKTGSFDQIPPDYFYMVLQRTSIDRIESK